MPPPPPPSRIEPLSFPVFGISWFMDPGNGRSITAYSGGGGSAKTGVFNKIVIQDGDDTPVQISTGDQVGVAIRMYKNPSSERIYMVAAMGTQVCRYMLPIPTVVTDEMYSSVEADPLEIGEGCNAIAVNVLANQLAVGCENGCVKVYKISDEEYFSNIVKPLFVCQGHVATVCSLSFSLRGERLISSAKDGTARVWSCREDAIQRCISTMICSIDDPKDSKKPKKPPQVLVRGCAFADMHGQVALTVASARRGKAFLSQWVQKQTNTTNSTGASIDKDAIFECFKRTECSMSPISAMSLSDDGLLVALGSVSGSILLWDVQEWKQIRVWNEVHDLPVTCIAARPYAIPLARGEQHDEVPIHARSASADSKLACLTLMRRAPKRNASSSTTSTTSNWSGTLIFIIHRIILLTFLYSTFHPVLKEASKKCGSTIWNLTTSTGTWESFRECFVDEVLIAPSSRLALINPPY